MLSGRSPDNIEKYLPWNMTAEKLKLFAEPPVYENSA
jgi:hypothetical protein